MIEKVDQRLKDWIADVSGIQDVHLCSPSDIGNTDSVGLYLLNIRCVPMARGIERTPHQLYLNYLITVWGSSTEFVHRTLGLLVFSAMSHEEFDVDTENVTPDLWRAFGISPRPAFILTVPLRKERPVSIAPFVREPIVIKQTPLQQLRGTLLGEGGYPLVGAKVDMPEFNLSTYTDQFGKFQFSSVPLTNKNNNLRIYAKGKVLSVTADESWCAKEPLIISFNTMEV